MTVGAGAGALVPLVPPAAAEVDEDLRVEALDGATTADAGADTTSTTFSAS